MKKFFYFMLVNVFLITTAFTSLSAQETTENLAHPSFQLLLSGGMGYAGNKDMNDRAKSVANDQVSQYNNYSMVNHGVDGEFSAKKSSDANINYNLDLEFRFFSSGNLGFGLGTGFGVAEGSYEVTSTRWGDKIDCSAFLMTIPLAGTLYYIAPLSEQSFFVIGGGIGYYFAFMDIDATNSLDAPYEINEPMFIGDTTGIGYHIKADYNYLIGALTLTGGIRARYVNFNEFDDAGDKLKIDAGLTGIDVYIGAGFAI